MPAGQHGMMTTSGMAGTFPLTFVGGGVAVTLIEIRAGERLRQRLAELGLTIGMSVRVVQSDMQGALILAVKNDTRLALGRGMAQKIMVRYAEGKVA